MPLPEKFYNMNDDEVTLEQLCHQEPGWAANRIRHLTEQVDNLTASQPPVQADVAIYTCPDYVDCFAFKKTGASLCQHCACKTA